MAKNESGVAKKHILNFIMYGVLFFCTGGLLFPFWIIYNLFKYSTDKEEHRLKNSPCEHYACLSQGLIRRNDPKNLHNEAKAYLYQHPNAYVFYIDNPFYPSSLDSYREDTGVVYACRNKGSFCADDSNKDLPPEAHVNPRYSNYNMYDDKQWWNSPYLYKYAESAVKKELAEKLAKEMYPDD